MLPGVIMHNHHCLSFSAYFGWNALTFPYALKTEGCLQLEQPLFLRMSSGVVPKTNLTFCSTPCEQRIHTVCRVFGGAGGVTGRGDCLCQNEHTTDVLKFEKNSLSRSPPFQDHRVKITLQITVGELPNSWELQNNFKTLNCIFCQVCSLLQRIQLSAYLGIQEMESDIETGGYNDTLQCQLNVGVSKPQTQRSRGLSKEDTAAANSHYFNLFFGICYIPMRKQIAKWYLSCS